MTANQIRKLALSFPEAVEKPHMARTSFRVREKIFATISEDQKQAVVFVHPREKRYALLKDHPDMFIENAWTKMGALGIELAKADKELVAELLEESWRRVAPKRAQALRPSARRGGSK
jgi:hypothetical protein